MSSIENYPFDIVVRTKRIINESYNYFEKKDLEVSLLMNCLLGLIVVVSENKKLFNSIFPGKIDQSFSHYIPDKIGYIIQGNPDKNINLLSDNSIDIPILHKGDFNKVNKTQFIKLIRNGIAHQNIEGINDKGKWKGIRIWNLTRYETKNFEVVFTTDEIKQLSLYIADQYTKKLEGK